MRESPKMETKLFFIQSLEIISSDEFSGVRPTVKVDGHSKAGKTT